MTAILITIKERVNLAWLLFQSLSKANLTNCPLIIINDASVDPKVRTLIDGFEIPGVAIKKIHNPVNLGVKTSLRIGADYALSHGAEFLCVLDGDSLVRHDFMDRLRELPQDGIATGFHCTTRNSDGSERHKITTVVADISRQPIGGWYNKESVGGLNMMFSKQTYLDHVDPALKSNGNWDHLACLSVGEGKVYCVTQSVVQHTGTTHSVMGHIGIEKADEATDFYLHSLDNVTLIGVSSTGTEALKAAAEKCTKHIRFGAVKLLTSDHAEGTIYIDPIKSIQEYSIFCLKKIASHIDTSHFLLIQHDSWILNPCAWDNSWLNYDNIGSVWHWYSDKYRGFNGGFAGRSKRLMEICANDDFIQPVNDQYIKNYAEDHLIGRVYRDYLEDKHGIVFADESEAEKFACEYYAVKPPHNKYKGQFGFHGFGNVDYSESFVDEPKPFGK